MKTQTSKTERLPKKLGEPNIVHLLLGLPSPQMMSGINVVVHHLAQAMYHLGYSTSVWSLNDHTHPEYLPEYPLEIFIRKKNRFQAPDGLAKAIQELSNSSIVHIHNLYTPEVRWIARQLHKRNIPYVLTPHGCLSTRNLKKNFWLKYPYITLFDNEILRKAKSLQALGEIEGAQMTKWNAQVKIIPNAFDPSELKPAYLPEDTAQLRFCFVGRITMFIKGLDLLFAGFEKYRSEGGTGKLRLIGGGHDDARLKKMVEDSEVAPFVEILGPKYGDEKMDLISESQVFVLTSRTEGLPMSVLEAAAIEKSLLVSKETNMGPHVDEFKAGIVLPENTGDCIAEAMHQFEQAFHQGTLQETAVNAKKMITQSLNWPNVAQRIADEIYLA
ncbi:MAG: glycosyltransferase family 4 protein [Bacteroidota bacterium]